MGLYLGLIQTCCAQLTTRITVKGYLSAPVTIDQGLRQGDPLSPLLYNIVLEPVLRRLQSQLAGITLSGFNLRVMAYADDAVVTLSSDRDTVTLQHTLDLHERACNACINRHKSLVVYLPGTEMETQFRVLRWNEPVTYLGFIFRCGAIDHGAMRGRIMESITKTISAWEDRPLSLCGKVLLLNTFVLSRLWYAAHSMPLDKEMIKTIETEIRSFLWSGSKAYVRLDTISSPRRQGGLGLLQFERQCQAMMVKFFKRIFAPDAPEWCVMARVALAHRLEQARLAPHTLLLPRRGRINQLPKPRRSLLRAWYALGGGCRRDWDTLTASQFLSWPIGLVLYTVRGPEHSLIISTAPSQQTWLRVCSTRA